MDPAAPHRPRWQRLLLSVTCGAAMGTADAVPGVSGGTVALIIGFYERFIAAIAAVVAMLAAPKNAGKRREGFRALGFLLPLGVGIIGALVLATLLLVDLLVHPVGAPIVYAFFFGLVLFSVPEPWRKKSTTHLRHIGLVPMGAAICIGLSVFPLGGGSSSLWLVVLAGAIAISVMLLPGVSGTLALVVIGMYHHVAGSVKDVVRQLTGRVDQLGAHAPVPLGQEWQPPPPGWQAWATLGCFALGIALGAALFIPFLRWLLKRAHDDTMALLTGLMAGSLVALWPWKTHYQPRDIPTAGAMLPRAPAGDWWWPVVAAAVGAAIIVGAEILRRRGAGPTDPGTVA